MQTSILYNRIKENKPKIRLYLYDLCKHISDTWKTSPDKFCLINPTLNLITEYSKFVPEDNTGNYDITVIVLACFWIADKFHSDQWSLLRDIVSLTTNVRGENIYRSISREEVKILTMLNFRIMPYLEFKEDDLTQINGRISNI